jgi:hypothetical protein
MECLLFFWEGKRNRPGFCLILAAFHHDGRLNLIILVPLMLAFGWPVLSQTVVDEPEANPGRPTVSTPATLTPVGYLQFETGFAPAFDSPEFSSRYGLNEVIKLAVVSRLELIVAAEPIVHFTAQGSTGNRVGDIFVGAQGVLYHGEGAKPSLAMSYLHRAYDGGAPEYYGSPTNSFLVLASADVQGFHYDANVFLTEMVQGSVRRGQFGQSLTISHPFLHRFTLSGEIWHFSQPFLRSNAVEFESSVCRAVERRCLPPTCRPVLTSPSASP